MGVKYIRLHEATIPEEKKSMEWWGLCCKQNLEGIRLAKAFFQLKVSYHLRVPRSRADVGTSCCVYLRSRTKVAGLPAHSRTLVESAVYPSAGTRTIWLLQYGGPRSWDDHLQYEHVMRYLAHNVALPATLATWKPIIRAAPRHAEPSFPPFERARSHKSANMQAIFTQRRVLGHPVDQSHGRTSAFSWLG